MKKRILSFLMAIVLILVLVPTAFAATNPWSESDAPSTWAQSYVREAYNQNLVPSNLMGRFDQPITRAEFAQLSYYLFRVVNGRESTPDIVQANPGTGITGRWWFEDTDDEYILKMGYIGVVRGVGNNRFNPDGFITREQAATMLSRLTNTVAMILPTNNAMFNDNSAIANWAMDHVGQMQSSGIMGGVGGNRFDPQGRYTIEQSITTMLRVYNYETSVETFLANVDMALVRQILGVDFTVNETPHAFLMRGAWESDGAGGLLADVRVAHWRFLNLSGQLNLSNFPANDTGNMMRTRTGDVVIFMSDWADGIWLMIDVGQHSATHRAYHTTFVQIGQQLENAPVSSEQRS